jgi:hypothetical protein
LPRSEVERRLKQILSHAAETSASADNEGQE